MAAVQNIPEVRAAGGLFPARLLILAGLALVAYLPSFHAGFQYDDFAGIVGNRYIQVKDLSSSSLWAAAFQDKLQNRPLSNLTLAVNYYFNGTGPFGYHLVNFLILIFSALGVWLLLEKLLVRLGFDPYRSRLAAWLVALAWAVHPINTQAVTYIIQRHASLAGLFSVWSIYLFHLGMERGGGRGRAPFVAGSFLLCAFALMSKEIAITLPAIMLAYKLYFFDEFKPGWLNRNWKWMLVLVVFYFAAGTVFFRPEMLAKVADDLGKARSSPWQRLAAEPGVLIWYLGIIVFPFPQFLSLLHDFAMWGTFFQIMLTVLFSKVIMAVVFVAVYRVRDWRIFSFCVVWWFGQLLVEVMPLPIAVAHEHRLFLASLGIIAPAIAWPVLRVKNLKAAVAWIIVIALFLSAFTFQRNRVWRSQESLWQDTAMKSPTLLWSWYHYCLALGETGKCRKTIFACSMATAVAEDNYKVHNNLGICYFKTGKTELAQKEFIRTLEFSPADVDSPALNLGLFYDAVKDYENAAKFLALAVRRNPNNAKTRYSLARTYLVLDKERDYQLELAETLKLAPGWSDVRLELAKAYVRSGKCTEALALVGSAPGDQTGFSEIRAACPEPSK